MRIQYRFPVRGVFRLSCIRTHSVGDALVTAETTELGSLTGLAVIFPFPDWRSFDSPKLDKAEDGAHVIHMSSYPRLDDAKHIVTTIEARLTPFGVDAIAVDQVTTAWVPESDEERESATHHHRSLTIGVPENAHARFRPGVLKAASRPRSEDPIWNLQLAFYRAAWIEMRRFQYVKAFFYFFFFFEGLYGNSQIKSAGLKRAFGADPNFVAALQQAIGKDRPNRPVTSAEIDAAIARVVDLRGFLFHNPGKRKEKWNPEKPNPYAADANLLANTAITIVCNREWPPEEKALPMPMSIVDDDRIEFDRFFLAEVQP